MEEFYTFPGSNWWKFPTNFLQIQFSVAPRNQTPSTPNTFPPSLFLLLSHSDHFRGLNATQLFTKLLFGSPKCLKRSKCSLLAIFCELLSCRCLWDTFCRWIKDFYCDTCAEFPEFPEFPVGKFTDEYKRKCLLVFGVLVCLKRKNSI